MVYTADGVTYTGFSLLVKHKDILKGEIVLVSPKDTNWRGMDFWIVEDKLGLDNLSFFYKHEYQGWPVTLTRLEVILEPVEQHVSKGELKPLSTERDIIEARYIVLTWHYHGIDFWSAASQQEINHLSSMYGGGEDFAITVTRKKCTH